MKGVNKMVEAIRGNGTARTILVIVGITTTIIAFVTLGINVYKLVYKQGVHEGQMLSVCETVDELKSILAKEQMEYSAEKRRQAARDEAQDKIVTELQRKQAFQEGLFTAKLDSVERAVLRVETYLLQWEYDDATETKN